MNQQYTKSPFFISFSRNHAIDSAHVRRDKSVNPLVPRLHMHRENPHYEITVWWEIFTGQSFRRLAAGKDFVTKFSRFDDRKPHPYWVYANHTHITCESAVMVSEFSV